MEGCTEVKLYNGMMFRLKNGERIYVRKAGHGEKKVILLPGNNTSGAIFRPVLSFVKAINYIKDAFTFYTFDYRGSGLSTYNKKIKTLRDFAEDFNEIINCAKDFEVGKLTLVGYSMGFGVAIEMLSMNPSKYDFLISLAGIGTRGIRIFFSEEVKDMETGKSYLPGDWIDSLKAALLHQRVWQGENRTFDNVKNMWNMVVFNDYMKFSPVNMKPTNVKFAENPFYVDSIKDVLNIEYMPESLYASHMFNASDLEFFHKNSDGTVVNIPGNERIKHFKGKKVLLLKARTDYQRWRGDLVIADEIFRNTKYDVKNSGGFVSAIIIEPNQGWDHGFPITHPVETLKIITEFINMGGNITNETLKFLFVNLNFKFYSHDETEWEEREFLGF